MRPIFITGIGTDVGKTFASAIITESLNADYWKPVQAGYPTDSNWVSSMISNKKTIIHPEAYLLDYPASPHISAAKEGIDISLQYIKEKQPITDNQLIIEGAGGLMVPLNNDQFIIDLIEVLDARVIIISQNYLGSINHSLLTYTALMQRKIDIIGWVFNQEFMNYENDICKWTQLPAVGIIQTIDLPTKESIRVEAARITSSLNKYI